jgi:hypothetical protein
MVAGGQQQRLTYGKRYLLRNVRSNTLSHGPDNPAPSATTLAISFKK